MSFALNDPDCRFLLTCLSPPRRAAGGKPRGRIDCTCIMEHVSEMEVTFKGIEASNLRKPANFEQDVFETYLQYYYLRVCFPRPRSMCALVECVGCFVVILTVPHVSLRVGEHKRRGH